MLHLYLHNSSAFSLHSTIPPIPSNPSTFPSPSNTAKVHLTALQPIPLVPTSTSISSTLFSKTSSSTLQATNRNLPLNLDLPRSQPTTMG